MTTDLPAGTTDIFTTGSARYVKRALGLWCRHHALWLAVPIVTSLWLGLMVDLRWLAVAAMLMLVVIPMVMLPVVLSRLTDPAMVTRRVRPMRVTVKPNDSIIIEIFMSPERREATEECETTDGDGSRSHHQEDDYQLIFTEAHPWPSISSITPLKGGWIAIDFTDDAAFLLLQR